MGLSVGSGCQVTEADDLAYAARDEPKPSTPGREVVDYSPRERTKKNDNYEGIYILETLSNRSSHVSVPSKTLYVALYIPPTQYFLPRYLLLPLSKHPFSSFHSPALLHPHQSTSNLLTLRLRILFQPLVRICTPFTLPATPFHLPFPFLIPFSSLPQHP